LAGTGIWQRAAALAAKAPPERNRVVDLLRAISILAVVVGHWLVAAPYMNGGAVEGGHLLGIAPWTQWLTWGFQVMPLFFLVGGFSNGMSWVASQRASGNWPDWFAARVRRLIAPVLPLFLVWTLFALFGTAAGVERGVVKMAAQLALIPVWFLAVYLIVTALTPLTLAAWRQAGCASVAMLVAGAAAVDIAALRFGMPYINFANFLFVWLAIHQLGFAWSDGRFAGWTRPLALGLAALAALALLVRFGPYPLAMIGVPGAALGNSMPPTVALLALGIMQTGLALALEPLLRRWLARERVWTGVVMVNGMIMTIYLWHLTAFVAVVVAAWLLGGLGLHTMPDSADWWLARPLWFALYIAATLPLVMAFVRFESPGREAVDPRQVPHWRLITGLAMICLGLAMTAAISIASPEGVTGVRLWVVALPFVGAALIRFGPVYSLAKRG
jgi:fucose 4-O-acetylase-like acetyltransferase